MQNHSVRAAIREIFGVAYTGICGQGGLPWEVNTHPSDNKESQNVGSNSPSSNDGAVLSIVAFAKFLCASQSLFKDIDGKLPHEVAFCCG